MSSNLLNSDASARPPHPSYQLTIAVSPAQPPSSGTQPADFARAAPPTLGTSKPLNLALAALQDSSPMPRDSVFAPQTLLI